MNKWYSSGLMSFAWSAPTSPDGIWGGHQGPSKSGAEPPNFCWSWCGATISKRASQVFCFVMCIFFLVWASRKPWIVYQRKWNVVETLKRKILAEVHLYMLWRVSKIDFKVYLILKLSNLTLKGMFIRLMASISMTMSQFSTCPGKKNLSLTYSIIKVIATIMSSGWIFGYIHQKCMLTLKFAITCGLMLNMGLKLRSLPYT